MFFNRVFHYKPSILGYPYFGNTHIPFPWILFKRVLWPSPHRRFGYLHLFSQSGQATLRGSFRGFRMKSGWVKPPPPVKTEHPVFSPLGFWKNQKMLKGWTPWVISVEGDGVFNVFWIETLFIVSYKWTFFHMYISISGFFSKGPC